MSDDEREVRLPPTQPITFGSLEERARHEAEVASEIEAGKRAGNINYSEELETEELNDRSKELQERKEKMMQALEQNRKARFLALPTLDRDVRLKLRAIGHPITLFGEGPGERRERLRKLLMELEQSGQDISTLVASSPSAIAALTTLTAQDTPKELFYTEGPPLLKRVRFEVAQWSLNRAKRRVVVQKERSEEIATLYKGQYTTWEEDRKEKLKTLRNYANSSSQIGGPRPITDCRLTPNQDMLVTVSWSGEGQVWELNRGSPLFALKGHTERIHGVDVHPACGLGLPHNAANIVTASADSTAKLWAINASSKPIHTLKGHTGRLGRCRFHPNGRMVATTSHDETWRLWDLGSGGTCLLEQEGHAKAVHGIAFHPDGSLVGTTSLDLLGRLWDIRTGKGIMVMEGHVEPVVSIDFSPNGYTVATGSDDHTVKIWDLRRKKCVFTIPAHGHLVSNVRFEPTTGWFLATSSYDHTAKLFAADTWTLMKTLGTHEDKVMSVDVGTDGRMIVTSGFDRTWKAWQVDQTAVKAEAKQEAKQEEAQVKVEPMDATENGVSTAQAP